MTLRELERPLQRCWRRHDGHWQNPVGGEIGRYYMHGVSHHLGIDTHDCAVREDLGLRAGMVISDEPGLYIDEEEIGIRIEDDLLITDEGCRVLSEAIPRTTEEIEALMAR
ncbi:MAG: M24 family metallopeptidase [Christensenellales bacterium]